VTKPKRHVRLGFSEQRDRTRADVRAFARWVFLHVVADINPEVLASLEDVTADDAVSLSAWAQRWHLSDDWCLAYARATVRAWRTWPTLPRCWMDRDDDGELYQPRPGRHTPRPKKKAEHFRWLVAYQVLGQPYRTPKTREACIVLAELLGLTLRTPDKGWTRRNRQRQRPH
jgi:hypothetical protein